MTASVPGQPIEINKIIEYLPHRFPFLLVDRVLDWQLEPVKRITAIKNVIEKDVYLSTNVLEGYEDTELEI